ncbi:hypothetical protein ACFQ60_22755 [Streptomyces zhihengii]
MLLIKNHLLCSIDPVLVPPSAGAAPRPGSPPGTRRGPTGSGRTRAAAAPRGVPGARGRAGPAAAPGVPPADGDLLPQRRRHSPLQGAQAVRRAPAPRIPARSPEESAAALGALQSATNAARQAAATEGNDPR